jgi:ribosome-associated protein
MKTDKEAIRKELRYKTSRSGGKGGQNVNKVSSKVEVLFDFESSALFTSDEKNLLREKLRRRMSTDGWIHLTASEERSQLLNKEIAIEKLMHLLDSALEIQKPRKKTRPSKSSVEKRLNAKKLNALRKASRRSFE